MYKWFKIKNGFTGFASILLEITPCHPDEDNKIIEEYTGIGFTSQGTIEEVPQKGYDSWKQGVIQGLKYGLSKVDTKWLISIKKLEGISTDTNPTIAGYTALRAFWDKIYYPIDQVEIDKIENFVFKSWKEINNQTFIPDFESLTSNPL